MIENINNSRDNENYEKDNYNDGYSINDNRSPNHNSISSNNNDNKKAVSDKNYER